MMVLANLAGTQHHVKKNGLDDIEYYDKNDKDEDEYFFQSVSFFVALKYYTAKKAFMWSAADSQGGFAGVAYIGGMVHAHMPITYYFLTNDYNNALS